ncbi:MAG: trypsin-like peptidase domain-containing protein [Gammaproteobacteria bacterium]|nr:trypsin-like peptidase domain-containing protein [Gammaproteobacteria bacterium]
MLVWTAVGLALAFTLVWLFPGLGVEAPPPAVPQVNAPITPGPASYHDAVAAVGPAVVNVYAIRVHQPAAHPLFQDPLFKRFFGEPPAQGSVDRVFGSGVILDATGLVVTNLHLIRNAQEIRVTLSDGRQIGAAVIGVDPETELALLQLGETQNLPAAPIGDSGRMLVGDVVLAIGNPYDFGQTVTQGIVSATGRTSLGITAFEDFIQTDADINPGNSGGALINARGELVGINTANYSETGSGGSQGIGFAIPINLTMAIVRELLEHGVVERGWLGIEAQALPPGAVETSGLTQGGVLVAWVLRDGPAEAAGLQPGDILTQVNGQDVNGPRHAIHLIAGVRPGTEISLRIVRGWEEKTVRATVGKRPRPSGG